ncbi:MAG: GNAT family N-acetyltransferase [Bacteroidales bacterium]|nr:GNAT family N-acetyltransferase [Bacteroidales bacterium]MCD8393841.1 GNAT family N-acetyltransferase [Bacteroidales bacterium]
MIEWDYKTYDELTKEELYAILRLRAEIFIVEQNCVYLDLDGNDRNCWHLMGRDGSRLVAYMRIVPLGVESDTEGSIGRIVVAKDKRGTGLGHELVDRGIELYNRLVGAEHPIFIHAQSQLEKFYNRHGFVAVSDPYMFEGLPHTNMIKKG